MEKGKMKEVAAIYIRVSTDDQTEENQIADCKKLCEDNGWEIVAIFKDRSKSAYHNVKRPGYVNLLEMVKKKKIKIVVVWALDRLTRRGPKELKNIINYFDNYNVQVYSINEPWISNVTEPGLNYVRDIAIDIVGWMAYKESFLLGERVRKSKKFKKAMDKGKVGRPGLPDEVKQRVLKFLREGKSYSYIQKNVSYKVKYGKVKHVSAPTISEIKKKSS